MKPLRSAGTLRATGGACGRDSRRLLDFSHCYLAGSGRAGFGEDFFHVANKAAREVAMMDYSSHVELCRSPLVLMVLFWVPPWWLGEQNDREVLDD